MIETLKKVLLYLPDRLIDLLWHFEMRRLRRKAVAEGIRRGYLPVGSQSAK